MLAMLVMGLQSLTDCVEVRRLIGTLATQVERCTDLFNAQAIGNACYGLQSLTDCVEAQRLVEALAVQVERSTAQLAPHNVASACYGLQSIVAEALAGALAQKVEHCRGDFDTQLYTFSCSGLFRVRCTLGGRRLEHALERRYVPGRPPWIGTSCPSGLPPFGGEAWIDPLRISFTQESCSERFRFPTLSIFDTAHSLIQEQERGDQERGAVHRAIPVIDIVWHRQGSKCRFFTLDNRRLAANRLVALALKHRWPQWEYRMRVNIISPEQAQYRGWAMKHHTGFWMGRSIRIEGSQLRVGLSQSTTTYGNALFSN